MATPTIKTVNVNATIPIRDITPPMRGVYTNIKMTISDILKCLCRRAIVEEVLADGTTVRLTMKNFRDNNSYLMKNPGKTVELTPTCPEHPDGCIDHCDHYCAELDDAGDDDAEEPAEDGSLEDFVTQEDNRAAAYVTSGYIAVAGSEELTGESATVTATTGDAAIITGTCSTASYTPTTETNAAEVTTSATKKSGTKKSSKKSTSKKK